MRRGDWRLRERARDHWLAVRVSVWLAALPWRLRVRGLPGLLASTAMPPRREPATVADRARAVRIVRRACRLPVFRLPGFPRLCLREALALHHVLTGIGEPVRVQIGVRLEDGHLVAHSWVSSSDAPLSTLAARCRAAFMPIYTSPPAAEITAGSRS